MKCEKWKVWFLAQEREREIEACERKVCFLFQNSVCELDRRERDRVAE